MDRRDRYDLNKLRALREAAYRGAWLNAAFDPGFDLGSQADFDNFVSGEEKPAAAAAANVRALDIGGALLTNYAEAERDQGKTIAPVIPIFRSRH